LSNTIISECVILNEDDYTFYRPRKVQTNNPNEKTGENTPNLSLHNDTGQSIEAMPPIFLENDVDMAVPDSSEKNEDDIDVAALTSGEKSRALSYGLSCTLQGTQDSEEIKEIKDARLLASSCFKGRLWSLTVRSKENNRPTQSKEEKQSNSTPELRHFSGLSKYQASNKSNDITPFSIKDICESLKTLLFGNDELQAHGAVIVTGATASGKSQITMGLIHDYLLRCANEYMSKPQKRKPHLVTVEDPIEDWFLPTLPNQFALPASLAKWSVDYTPRQIGTDVESVSLALRDALRQTPSAVFISEIRDDRGWKDMMDFAGTGHLVFATGHAGCLTEAMGKILKALEAKTPADRAVIAERILGLVHVRRVVLESEAVLLMPSLWRRQGAGKQSFISDGLSALAPQTGKEKDISAFGRLWFTKNIMEQCKDEEIKKKHQDNAYMQARKLDLEGQ